MYCNRIILYLHISLPTMNSILDTMELWSSRTIKYGNLCKSIIRLIWQKFSTHNPQYFLSLLLFLMNIRNTNIHLYGELSWHVLVVQGVVLPAVLAILCTQLAILIDIRWGWREILRRMRSSAANRLIGEVVQSRRGPLLGPSPGWKRLLPLSHLRHY